MIRSKFLPLWIMLPGVLILAAWILSLEWRLQNGVKGYIAIEGYDPRDLLSGHYSQFRVSMEDDSCRGLKESTACVCLLDNQNAPQYLDANLPMWHLQNIVSCDLAPQDCKLHLKGYCNSNEKFRVALERFYIPETMQDELQTLPPSSYLKVSLFQGKALVSDLIIDGKSIKDR